MSEFIEIYRTPGQLLSYLLQKNGWTGRMLSAIMNMDETSVNRLIQDKKTFTAEIALVLEDVFGLDSVRAEDFLLLQSSFDLATARIKIIHDPTRQLRVKLYGELPINEMIKRGWINIENRKDYSKVESEILSFFKAASLEEIGNTPHSARKTNHGLNPSHTQLAWINRVKHIAMDLLTPPFVPSLSNSLIDELKPLLISAEAVRKIPRLLAEYGIRLVFVEPLKGSKIDGVCLWLDENKPVIGMSIRFDRIDNFWFVLRHELEHVFQGHGKQFPMIDTELDGTNIEINTEEEIANREATEFIIPTKKMDSFILRKSPFFSEMDIVGFAKTLKIHPGLVAGQLRFRTKKFTQFGKHLVPVRVHLLPNAVVDGWGETYPLDD